MNADDVKPQTDGTFTPPDDPSQYIRTYAKDVAQLSKIPPKAEQSPASAVSSAPTVTPDVQDAAVTLPEFDASPVDHKNDPVSPKEFEQEMVTLSKDDSDGIFVSKSEPQKTPLMPQAGVNVIPDLPKAPVPMPAPAPAPTPIPAPAVELPPDPGREAVLARLRAKLASHGTEPSPLQASVPAVQEPAPVIAPQPAPQPRVVPEAIVSPPPSALQEPELLRTAAPVFNPSEAAFKATLSSATPAAERPQPVPAPVVVPAPLASPLHTFSSDFADRIDRQNASTFSVLAAQNDAPAVQSLKPTRRIQPRLVIGVVLLILGIGIIAGAVVVFMNRPASAPFVASVPSLVAFDESVEVHGTGSALMQNIADVAGGASVAGNVVITYLSQPGTTGASIPQPGGAVISAFALPAPDILLRNIDTTSTVGAIHAGSESKPFLVLRVNSYERTFAGMLAWEPTMATDLAVLFPPYPTAITPSVATTSSSTPTAAPLPAPASPYFSDAVVANQDVRVLRDAQGRSLLLYGYHGKDTLIIARDEAAFSALIARLSPASGN
ncbi:MAG: hypothetical protein V4480_01775 [Patescibacteria group bacterium]